MYKRQEQQALDAAVETLRGMASVPCTNCRYCVKDCPQGVSIPEIMGLLNLELMTENNEFVKGLYQWQAPGRDVYKRQGRYTSVVQTTKGPP